MSMPEIIEQPPPSSDSKSSDSSSRSRRFSVIARSRMEAEAKLAAAHGIVLGVGVVFRDHKGNIDPICILQNINTVGRPDAPTGGTGHYIIDCSYSSESPEKKPQPGGPWIWTPRPALVSAPVDLDYEGKPIWMSSEEPLDTPLSPLHPEEILHGEGYVAAASALAAYKPMRPYIRKLNSVPFLGAPKGCVLAYVPTMEDSDSGWIKVSWDVHYKPPKTFGNETFEGWQDVFIDRGTRVIADSNSADPKVRYRDITLPDENKVSRRIDSPVPLNGSGQTASPITKISYRVVTHYGYIDLNTLPGLK